MTLFVSVLMLKINTCFNESEEREFGVNIESGYSHGRPEG